MTTEACDDRRGAIATAALARLDDVNADELAAHLATCAACRNETARLRPVAALLPLADPAVDAPSAPAELGRRVLEEVDAAHRARTTRRRAAWLAAAALLAVAVVATGLVDRGDDEPAGVTFAFADAPAGADADATVAADGGGSVVALRADGLDPAVVYALWLSNDAGDRAPAGTFRASGDGQVDVQLLCAMPADEVDRVWATTPAGETALDGWLP